MTGKIPKEGVLFDLAVLAANIWLVPRLSRLSGPGGSGEAAFGLLLVFSLPVYCLGAGLKRGPLGERLRGSKPPFGNPWPTSASDFRRWSPWPGGMESWSIPWLRRGEGVRRRR